MKILNKISTGKKILKIVAELAGVVTKPVLKRSATEHQYFSLYIIEIKIYKILFDNFLFFHLQNHQEICIYLNTYVCTLSIVSILSH